MGASNSKLSVEQLNDLTKHTLFDKKEIQAWYKGYLKDFPTGFMEQQDFRKIYKQFFPFGEPNAYADFVFNVFDLNKDGYVDFKEFMYALSVTTRGNLEDKMEWAFNLYDMDKDGYISKGELMRIVESMYKMTGNIVKLPMDEETPEKRVALIFELMDKDKDGRISKEEFKEGSKKDPSLLHSLSIYDGLNQ